MTYRIGDPLIRFRVTRQPARLVLALVVAAVRILNHLVYGIRIVGRENLDATPRAVLVSNHTLLLDPGVLAHAIHPRRTYFTMLEETALVRGLGTFVRLLGAVPLPARPSARGELGKTLRSAVEEVGYVHFFAEGECYQWSQEIHPLHRGAFQLALHLGLPVIPMAIVLHDRPRLRSFLRRLTGRAVRVPPRVTVVICPALRPATPRCERRAQHRLVPFSPAGGGTGRAGVATVREPADAPSVAVTEREATRLMAERARDVLQAAIDKAGGCKTIYRGWMPRLVGPGRRGGPPAPLRHGGTDRDPQVAFAPGSR